MQDIVGFPAARANDHRSLMTFWHRVCRLGARVGFVHGSTHDLFHQSRQGSIWPVMSSKPAVSYRPGYASGYRRRMRLRLLVGALLAGLTGYAGNHVRSELCVTRTLAESSEYEAARCRVALYPLFGRETSMYPANAAGTFRGSLFCATALLYGCSASSLGPAETVNMVVVSFDSRALLPGETTQAFARATDAFGNDVPARGLTWRSLNTSIATVSAGGQVTGLAPGSVLIEGRLSDVAGSSPITVNTSTISLPATISASFDDGTIGGFGKWESSPGKISVIDDPTGSGRGKVARLRYGPVAARSTTHGADDNTSLTTQIAQRWGETIFFKGDYYINVADLGPQGEPTTQRKFIYFKSHEDWSKYPTTGGHRFRTRVMGFGPDLVLDSFFEPRPGESDTYRTLAKFPNVLEPRKWFTLEVQQTMESALGAGDGIIRVWKDGVLLFEKTTMRFTYAGWTDQSVDDMYFETFLVGQQVNTLTLAYDEDRYLDNVSFSSQRIGR